MISRQEREFRVSVSAHHLHQRLALVDHQAGVARTKIQPLRLQS